MPRTKKAMIEEKKLGQRLLKIAEDTNDLRLYKLANGEGEIIDYLIQFVKDNQIGGLSVCGETLDSVLRANSTRRKRLMRWFQNDTDPTYKELHYKEIQILDEYAETMLIEIFKQLDDLKVKAAADVEAREKAAADRAAKRAEKSKE